MKSLGKSSLPDPFTSPPLKSSFFLQDTVTVARALLGKGLFLQKKNQAFLCEIVEVEAYLPKNDEASHSFKGPTPRNQSMFEVGGTAYVYLIYGMYHCVNVVTEGKGQGAAVLIRAAIPTWGHDKMLKNRKLKRGAPERALLSGPGKLTQALGIDLAYDGLKFDRPDFKIVDLGKVLGESEIGSSPRIGISTAQDKFLRFFVKNSPWLSKK